MRIFLLRLFLGWWMVPLFWTLMWAIGWLMSGDIEETNDISRIASRAVWFGELP